MALREEAGWHATHAAHYGHERWEDLVVALHREHEHLCYLNQFVPADELELVSQDYSLEQTRVPGAFHFRLPDDPDQQYRVIDNSDETAIFVDRVREKKSEVELLSKVEPGEELSPFAYLEGATLMAATALEVEVGDRVLDACAAPGGTSLVLASALFSRLCSRGQSLPQDVTGLLVCNEVSKARASRLQQTLRSMLPPTLFDPKACPMGARVVFTSADMGTPHNSAERNGPYDKILLSAPCTDDRSMLRGTSAGGLARWSAATAKVSAERQVKWLHNALWLLAEGGLLVFVSKALSPEECDGVIERLMLKVRGTFDLEVLPLEERLCRMVPNLAAESTDWGARIMPDKTFFGPLYFSRIRLLKRSHQAAH
eukprot:TRINITY_DN62868_c0_g1_i1.p1 TRINITY_DN62868_c0_g1~~TRINITY_DN62868_c0_g1_i1.p1  ORF type:complete len:371 (+),score=50.74 TRINITY_DN62868_c0_g1_i1:70-1182(+)